MNSSNVKQLTIAVIAVLLMTFLYIKTQAVEGKSYNSVLNNLSQLRQLDASLGRDVLRSRNELLSHYDPLVLWMQQLREKYAEITAGTYGIYHQGNLDIDQHLDAIQETILAKEETLESFKSHNAILRNSVHYIPSLMDQLMIRMAEHNAEMSVVVVLSDMVRDVLSYNTNASTGLRLHVINDYELVARYVDRFPPVLQEDILRLIQHVEVVVNEKQVVDAMILSLTSPSMVRKVDRLSSLYNRNHEALVQRTNIYRLYLYLITVSLLIYVAFIMWKLKNSATKLRRTVRDLNYQKFALDQHSIVSIVDSDGLITYANDKLCDVSQFRRDELIGKSHRVMNSGYHSDVFFDGLWATITAGDVWHGEIRSQKKNGDYFWVDSTIVPFVDSTGSPYQYVAIRTDVTEHKRLERALFKEKERAQITLESIGDGVITTNAQGLVDYMNPRAEMLAGVDFDACRGHLLSEVLNIFDEVTHKTSESPINACLQKGNRIALPGQVIVNQFTGKEFAVEVTASPILDRESVVVGVVIIFHDVTELRGLANKVSYQATHDALTGLINRREFERRLALLLESARQEDKEHALCYIDLDQFKIVNDTCGHVAGDELLRQLTTLLQAQVRERDTLARLGGDEFGILLGNCHLNKAEKIAEAFCHMVKEFRFVWQDKSFEIGASIGLVAIEANSGSTTDLLSAADSACYVAKDKGRNRVYVYQPDDEELVARHGEMQWVSRINQALEENRFELFYQPIVALQGGKEKMHVEVLLRLRDEAGKLIFPMAFIPAAERFDLMPAIDRWVIRNVFAFCEASGRDDITYAVNLSGASLSDAGLMGYLREQFSNYDVRPYDISFEITETAAISNLSEAIHFISELKILGCSFSLDDFGSGLSSFAYLKNLPVDYLKIDGGFIRSIVDNPIDCAMVESINHIGHVMGIKTIAEFVENDEIYTCIKNLGVDYAQGYYIEKPKPLSDLFKEK
ncbi:MAG: EAL domain-containing protein [Thiotrichaceae bacterium]|nr:EAL domain-containing protein [Thiotrichaceae bacterium]PCI13720.1 MAG: hypothetical protein COB71_04900 [Thiotrichales bacterium]